MQSFPLKFVLVGDSRVGKSQLSKRFVKGEFANDSTSTVGMEFSTRSLPFERCNLNAQIWDLAGQARGSKMTSHYYKDAVGAILIFDITNKESFNSIRNIWMPQIREFGHPNINIILIGNKVDMNNDRKITTAAAIELVQEFNLCGYIEVSALSGEHVENAFRRIIYTVGSILPAVKVHLDVLGLPVGWMINERSAPSENNNTKSYRDVDFTAGSSPRVSNPTSSNKSSLASQISPRSPSTVAPPPANIITYMNYWTGAITPDKPTLAAEDFILYRNLNTVGSMKSITNNGNTTSTANSTIHKPSPSNDRGPQNANMEIHTDTSPEIPIKSRVCIGCCVIS